MNENILQELKRPFHPSAIEWKPQATTKDGSKAMAAAYADLRAYQNRLDEVCGMDWSVTYTPWGDRIVCHVTIKGVTRSSSGEGDKQSEKSEIAGTAAEAQAFKRACAMFGLGRYLYEFPTSWVEFDGKTFTESGKKKLDQMVAQHYQRHTTTQVQPTPPTTTQAPSNGNGHTQAPPPEDHPFTDPNAGVQAQRRQQREAMIEKAAYWRKMDDAADPCSTAQYGYFVSVVEAITGKNTHPQAFNAMFKRVIDGDNRPGKKAVQWLFDVLPETVAEKDANNKPVKNEAGKNIYIANTKRDMVAVEAVKTLYASTVKQDAANKMAV